MPIPRISPRTHGVLDYTTGAALLAAPRVLGLRGTAAGAVLRAAGASHIGYSLLTAYDLGVAKVVPYRAHLAVDAVAAVGLAAAPVIARRSRRRAQWLPHGLFGLWEAAAVALSVPEAVGGAADPLAASDGAADDLAASDVATDGGATDGQAAPDIVTDRAALDAATGVDPTPTVLPEGADVALADRGGAARRDGLGGSQT